MLEATIMKNISLIFLLLFLSQTIIAQSPVGTWKTVDDNTGEEKSYIQISVSSGKYVGKISKLLLNPPDTTCDECPGDKKDKPLVGMEILWDLKPYKDHWSYGQIMDPENGKTYKCSIWLEGDDLLKVRGYIGISALGRTQTWHRVQ